MPRLSIKLLIIYICFNTMLLARDIDINRLSQSLNKTDKHLFLFLHRTDCGYCDSMIMFTLDDDVVRPMIEHDFVYEHININDKDTVRYKDFIGSGRDFAKKIGYDMYPTSVFLDKNNTIVFVAPGKREEDPFLTILKYVNTHAYSKMDLESFENMLDFKKQ